MHIMYIYAGNERSRSLMHHFEVLQGQQELLNLAAIKQGHFKLLNSHESDFSEVGSLCKLIFTQYFPTFVSFLHFIKVIRGKSTSICNEPVRQFF